MAKQNQQNQPQLSTEEKARLEEETLLAQIAEAEAAAKAEEQAKADAEKQAESENQTSPEEKVELDEFREHKIKILKTTPNLKEGNEHVVSGNVANILIKRGIAKLVETMPEKSKINP